LRVFAAVGWKNKTLPQLYHCRGALYATEHINSLSADNFISR